MATCKDCIHYDVCVIMETTNDYDHYTEVGCEDFTNKADVVEVKHSFWIENKKVCNSPYCSVCGAVGGGSYCHHCGAKMDLKEPTYCKDKKNKLIHCEDCHLKECES